MEARPDTGACPCGSGRPYEDCCGRYHDGSAWPPDPESLVRARYCAYARGKWRFLVDTHRPAPGETAPTAEELERDCRGVAWHSLRIAGVGSPDGDGLSHVDFYAWYAMDDGLHQLGERGFFREADGRLFYVGGRPLAPDPIRREGPKIGRNDPCPCGSGKKYKKCCGRSA